MITIPNPRETAASICPARSVISSAVVAPSSSLRIQLLILFAESTLRGDLLGKEAIGGGGGDAPGRRVGLEQKPGVLQIGHDVTDTRGTQLLRVGPGDGPARDGFAGSHVGAHDLGQYLPISV